MRIIALIKRICQQMLRDKRTLALLFFAPLLVLTLMYFLFNSNDVDPKIGVQNVDNTILERIEKANITTTKYLSNSEIHQTIIDDQLDGFLKIEANEITLVLQNSDPSKAKMLGMKIQQLLSLSKQETMMKTLGMKAPSVLVNTNIEYVYGNIDTNYFDALSPILVGYFVFFFVFLISGIGLLRERTTGTLERLMSTPIKRGEIVTGYLIGYGLFAVIQTIIVVFYSIQVLDIVLEGSIGIVILINLLLALVALSLGILLSSFAASEFQMIQFIPIIVIPQVFFTGIFPLESMPSWMQLIAKIMPMYYGATSLKAVMYKGEGMENIYSDLLALTLFALVFIVLNVVALKKYRAL